jgi:hypothetical protein
MDVASVQELKMATSPLELLVTPRQGHKKKCNPSMCSNIK